jgi:hypothetical protein
MTAVLSDYHGHAYPLADVREAGKRFDWQADLIMPTGTPGQVLWVGTDDNRKILRVDIDVDQGRAALRWLPDGTHAVDLEPGPSIETYATSDGELAHIPGSLARVSPATARQVVTEFVATERKPTCVTWQQ